MWKCLVVSAAVLVGAGCGGVLAPVVAKVPQQLQGSMHQPRVVWVLDRSGSMADPLNGADSTSKLAAVQGWLRGLGGPLRATPRHGLVAFPAPNTGVGAEACTAATAFDVEVPSEGAPDTFPAVLTKTEAFVPSGGTPISAALELVAQQVPDEPWSDTYVVLLTDGMPNCNPANSSTCANPAACRCGNPTCGVSGTAMCTLICLDDLGLIGAGRAVANRGLRLMVVGVGAGAVTEGAALYSTLEPALSRTCRVDADCRAGTACDQVKGLCVERMYGALTVADLPLASARLAAEVERSARCTFWFDQALDVSLLSVELEGRVLAPGADGLGEVSSHRVVVQGAACERLLAQPSLTPVFTQVPSR